jgi:GTP-binding protein
MAKFIDEAKIKVRSGNGGPGCVSFHRAKYVPKGGPDGGDGGKGGDVYLVSDRNLATLLDYRYQRFYEAENGRPGLGSLKTGRDGKDIEIRVPVGTVVYDANTNEKIYDFLNPDEKILICKGGRGGKGNAHFATSTHQAPKFAQPGEPGEEKELRFELKLLADVGLVGYPNAGKSTLISKISAARPKIADYPFTTLVPNLGVVRFSGSNLIFTKDKMAPTFVVADVPGLIEGASLGRGLGIKFLKHLDRTKLLVHLIDGAKLLKEFSKDLNPKEVAKGAIRDKEIIDAELYTFSEELAQKPQILAFNKCDLFTNEFLMELKEEFKKLNYDEVYFISGAAHQGLQELLQAIVKRLFNQNPTN